ncbi:hypothetical protein BC834DRAFT_806497, partial [Gloeopeniophorella convolvens]
LYLVGLIPGPREPAGVLLDNFLRPLVGVLQRSWATGARYPKTYTRPDGRLVRSALILSVNDLPMARKIRGTKSFLDQKKVVIDNPDIWKMKPYSLIAPDAAAWLNTPTNEGQRRFYNRTGVRHSILMELPYWDPVEMVVIDGMHNLFLGQLQNHSRTVMGMDSASNPRALGFGLTEGIIQQIEAAKRLLLTTGTTPAAFRAIGVKALTALCHEEGHQEKKARRLARAILLSPNDWKAIRADIAETTRPNWHVAPPPNLGELAHGKLKADEWRSCFEFDLPVSLLQIHLRRCRRGKTVGAMQTLVQSTFFLATAVRWGTSHRTSETHIKAYERSMQAYLNCLKGLQPDKPLKPNHYNSLLFGFFLRRYGPAHGWWMFPFERVIGRLQKTNTNGKL